MKKTPKTERTAASVRVSIDPVLAAKVLGMLPRLKGGAYGSGSHGPLTLTTLVHMLLQDVEMTSSRPGSWEGANMAQVLASHGYGNGQDF